MINRILVVGAAGGVGTEVVRLLLASGADVLATVLDSAEASQVRTVNPKVGVILEMDCADADSVKRILAEHLAALGGSLNAVVVCAAISPYGPVETEPLAVARRTFEINTLSGIAIFQATMPLLRQNRGRIVYISSMAGRFGMPFIGYYTASKFALEGAVETMRCEAAPWGVELVLVEPGGIQTPMMTNQVESLMSDIERLDANKRQLYGDLYAQFRALAAKSYATALKPSQVANVVLQALSARKPKVRYKVGKDSVAMCFLAWLVPRRWVESIALGAFRSALK